MIALTEARFGWYGVPVTGWFGIPEYLGVEKLVHGKIDTRNIMVDPQMVSLVGEYGEDHTVLLVAANKTIIVEGSMYTVKALLGI